MSHPSPVCMPNGITLLSSVIICIRQAATGAGGPCPTALPSGIIEVDVLVPDFGVGIGAQKEGFERSM